MSNDIGVPKQGRRSCLRGITRFEILSLLLIAVAYAVVVISHWNEGYLDFGDGNYMYISWRLSEGAVLYRDILAPQPPLHLYLGAVVAWIGDRVLPHPLWAFRTFSLCLHIATMALVWLMARTLHQRPGQRISSPAVPLAAAVIYMVQPIGFWWTLGYQSQPLLIFLLLIMVCGVLRNSFKGTIVGGICGGLALLTNMTTAPYVAFTVGWMFLRRFKRGVLFALCVLILPLIVIPAMQAYTGHYISNVFQNQAGAFPRSEVLAETSDRNLWGYISRKLIMEGGDVLRLQGTWVALAALGMILFAARRRNVLGATPDDHANGEYALFFTFFSICSILYVSKGGTVDYVFSLAEPYVALFAAPVIVGAWRLGRRAFWQRPSIHDFTPLAGPLVAGVLLLSVAWPGLHFIWLTLKQHSYELNERETRRVVSLVRQRTKPDDLIIAPPHFAFMAQRRIVNDYSEHFLWRIKYMNEHLDNERGPAIVTAEQIAAQLRDKKVPFLVMDMNQTGTIPEISEALEQSYRPLLREPLQMLNTPIMYYEPAR